MRLVVGDGAPLSGLLVHRVEDVGAAELDRPVREVRHVLRLTMFIDIVSALTDSDVRSPVALDVLVAVTTIAV